jgi:hypothetical protein
VRAAAGRWEILDPLPLVVPAGPTRLKILRPHQSLKPALQLAITMASAAIHSTLDR